MSRFLEVTHLGGLPEFKENGDYTLVAKNDGLTVQIDSTYRYVTKIDGSVVRGEALEKKDLGTYFWNEIEVFIGTGEELKEELLLSRIAPDGPFKIFFTGQSTSIDCFLTIRFKGHLGLFKVYPSASGGSNKFKAILKSQQKPI
jgi:hypothetical protein